jgi:hypothetical protein
LCGFFAQKKTALPRPMQQLVKPFSVNGDSSELILNLSFHFLALYKGRT